MRIGIFFLNIIYLLVKLVPTKNKVTFISRQSNNIPLDFELLQKELEKQISGVEICQLCKAFGNKPKKNLIYNIKYCLHIFKQMYHIASSKVVILDSYCIAVSVLKHKKSLKVIQIWHSMGTMKKFGYAILDSYEGSNNKIAKTMKMHNNYDYILCSSEAYADHLQQGFNCDKNKIIINPLPRYDLLKSESYAHKIQSELLIKQPSLKNKKNILYCPTFRKNETKVKRAIKEIISVIDFDRYNLIVCLHPLSKITFENSKVINGKDISTFEWLFIADYVVSDYSCVIYEAAILNKPIYLFNYDFEDYEVVRGLAIDYYKEMPGLISKSFKDIFISIEADTYDYSKLIHFKNKYIKDTDNATQKIVDFIVCIMQLKPSRLGKTFRSTS